MEKGQHKNNKWLNIGAFFVFALIILLRLWKVQEYFSFNFDEEYQATLAWSLVKDFHVIWIGVSTSGLKYYLGPGFTYLNWLLFKIGRGDPLMLAYFASIWGIVTSASVWYVTSRLVNKKAALFAALLYGVSAFFIFYDRRFWNPLPIPFISIWMVYTLTKAKENSRWLIVSAILMASAYHVHLSLMVFWPVFLYVIFSLRKKIHITTWALMFGSYLLVTSPLIVFDFVHNFDNILAPLRFIQSSADGRTTQGVGLMETMISHGQIIMQSLGKILFLKPFTNIQEEHNLGAYGGAATNPPLFLSLVAFGIVAWFVKKNIKVEKLSIVVITLIVYAILFVMYSGVAGSYFILAPLTLVTVAFGWFLGRIDIRPAVLLAAIFTLTSTTTIVTATQERFGLKIRKEIVIESMHYLKDEPFALEIYGKDPRKYHPYGGWRYLYKAYGRTPVASFADEPFGWIYPDELSSLLPTYTLVIHEDLNKKPDGRIIATIKKGAYTAYVIQNKK